MNYISLIEELKKRGSIPGLDAIQGLLEELGHPEDDLKIVHIAGLINKEYIKYEDLYFLTENKIFELINNIEYK